jgi:hypothetical protein
MICVRLLFTILYLRDVRDLPMELMRREPERKPTIELERSNARCISLGPGLSTFSP